MASKLSYIHELQNRYRNGQIMRRNPTQAEDVFWSKARNKKYLGLKFYRQYIIEHENILGSKSFYISDFYCHKNKVVIEIDGDVHDFQIIYDQIREERLIEMGYTVIRFRNDEVIFHWEDVASELKRLLL